MLLSDLVWGLDPVAFSTEALGIVPDDWQADMLRSNASRMLLNCSRQSGKSTTAATLASHTAIYRPGTLVILVSPSLRQSSELFRKVSDLFGELDARPAMAEDNRLSMTLENGSRIVSLPGSEKTIRGFSAAGLIIEDEASRVDDKLYYGVRPMLAVSGGRYVLMSTPFGKRGHFYEAWEHGGDDWERVEIPASACPRISPEFLEEELRAIGPWWFEQEYGCQFKDTTDAVFNTEDIDAAFDDDLQPLFAIGAPS